MRVLKTLLISSILLGGAVALEEGEIMTNTRTEFPEVVGMTGEAAKATLISEFPTMAVQVVPYGSMVTMDYREDRIRIRLDENGMVSKTPRIG
jgi:hypothetical protein